MYDQGPSPNQTLQQTAATSRSLKSAGRMPRQVNETFGGGRVLLMIRKPKATSSKTPHGVKRVLRLMHESVPVELRLGSEILEILWSYCLLKRQSLDSDIAFEDMRSMKFVQLLINDIILRLCKFRDTDIRSLSFDQVFKELRKREASKDRVKGVETRITEYQRLTPNLENHRDTYIAHLSKRDHTHLNPPVEMLAAIRMAVQLTDELVGSRNSYKLLDIDLRAEVLGEVGAKPAAAPARGGRVV